jgi:recombination protein RecT
MSKSLTTKPASVKDWLQSDNFKKQIALAMPKHLTPDRFCRVALTTLLRVPKLAQCKPESVINAIMTCSQLGIEPDGRRAHLIPFGDECQLIIDYKGLAELIRRSGEVSYLHADVVHENDEFEHCFGSGAILKHKPALSNRGKVIACYSFVKLKDGSEDFDVMNVEAVSYTHLTLPTKA